MENPFTNSTRRPQMNGVLLIFAGNANQITATTMDDHSVTIANARVGKYLALPPGESGLSEHEKLFAFEHDLARERIAPEADLDVGNDLPAPSGGTLHDAGETTACLCALLVHRGQLDLFQQGELGRTLSGGDLEQNGFELRKGSITRDGKRLPW